MYMVRSVVRFRLREDPQCSLLRSLIYGLLLRLDHFRLLRLLQWKSLFHVRNLIKGIEKPIDRLVKRFKSLLEPCDEEDVPMSLWPWVCQRDSLQLSVNSLRRGSSERVCIKISMFVLFKSASSEMTSINAERQSVSVDLASGVLNRMQVGNWAMRGLASWSSLSFLQNTAKNQSKYKSISNGEGEERMRTSFIVHEGFSQELKDRAP